jgi:hypothetical protein
MKRAKDSGRAVVSFDPKSSSPGFIFARHRASLARKKVYFSLGASSRALQVHPVACFERNTAKVEFLLVAKFLFETAIPTLHGAVCLGYREVRRLSHHAKSLTFLL